MATLSPLITAANTYPYSWGQADTYSYIPIVTDAGRPIFAKAVYDVTNAQALGQNGFVVSDTSGALVTGNFTTIQVISTAKLSSVGTAYTASVGNLSAYELPQGFTLNGPITSFSVRYGSVIAYKA
jgi:hypothetical protein